MLSQKKHLFLVIILSSFCFTALAFAASPPNAPKRQYWVTDQANIISSYTELQLTNDAKAHEKNTSDQVVVVTVKTLDGWTVERYAMWLGNTWGIGQRGKDNGVLLLVAPNERKVRIAVGVGLEDTITNSLAQSIIDYEILPRFKENQMEAGIIAGHRAIIKALNGNYIDKSWLDEFLILLYLPFFFLGRVFGFGGGSFSGGGGSFGGGGASGSW